MLSHNTLRHISETFNGDVNGLYQYKSGPKLVKFFNEYFGFSDSYGQGFPSRWYYTLDKLVQLIRDGRFNNFFNIILSKRYLMIENQMSEVEAVELGSKILGYFNSLLKSEGFRIIKKGDKYELASENDDLEYVGEGGFAVVYKRKSNGLIVKKLKEEFLDQQSVRSRFKREYKITKSLNDLQGVIEVYNFDFDDYSYTMQPAEKTLYKFIKDYDHSYEYKKHMIRQILNVMKEVHDRNIIHRDISPHNILVVSGVLKISDFGLGKDLDMFHSHRTINTNACGQLYYCAPEQFMKLKDGDKKSDVYSLGKLINFILTGDQNIYNHYLRSVVEKATNENPSYRYNDARELLNAVEKSISYHENAEKIEKVRAKAREGVLDHDVENYIYELSGKDFCKEFNISFLFLDSVIEFMKKNEKRSMEIIELINDSFSDFCGASYESYDPIAKFAYKVLSNEFPFVAKELSARILHFIAYDVNRFYAQRLIDELIEKGIEPMIEEILRC